MSTAYEVRTASGDTLERTEDFDVAEDAAVTYQAQAGYEDLRVVRVALVAGKGWVRA